MKKSVYLVISLAVLLVLGWVILTGCGNNESNLSETDKNVLNEFRIKDSVLKFNRESSFKGFSYKMADGLKTDESQQSIYLEYINNAIYDGRFVFRISMSFDNETNIKDFLEDRKGETESINGINWTKVTVNNTSNNKDTTSIIYATEKGSTLYVVSIISFNEANVNLSELSNVFINTVTLD